MACCLPGSQIPSSDCLIHKGLKEEDTKLQHQPLSLSHVVGFSARRSNCFLYGQEMLVRWTNYYNRPRMGTLYLNTNHYHRVEGEIGPPLGESNPQPCAQRWRAPLLASGTPWKSSWVVGCMYRYLAVTFLLSELLQTTPCTPYPSKQHHPTTWITELRNQCPLCWTKYFNEYILDTHLAQEEGYDLNKYFQISSHSSKLLAARPKQNSLRCQLKAKVTSTRKASFSQSQKPLQSAINVVWMPPNLYLPLMWINIIEARVIEFMKAPLG